MKKAAVYDRWFHALGGGEQVAFAYATALRDLGYKTDLLTHKELNIEEAEKKMNVNLEGIKVKYLPNLLDFQISQYTEQYDVFVSNSYLDYIPNRSKYGILSIFFPSRIHLSPYEYLKRALIVPSLRKFFIYPSRFEGFKYDEYFKHRIYKWLGKVSTISFNQDIKRVYLVLYFDTLAFSCIDAIRFKLNDELITPVDRQINVYKNTASYIFNLPHNSKQKNLSILLEESDFSEGVALTRVIIPSYRYFFYNLFKLFFPKLEMRLHGGPSVTRYSDVESYDKILTISKFSQRWIRNYWGMDSDVLYPPASIKDFQPAKNKENIITHVGRFFVSGHSKKQLDMLRVFKKLVDQGYKGWELHFIGSVAEGEIHQRYFNTVKEEAAGYPVFFHINVPFEELKTILAHAKIYWHATGLDEEENKNPIRLEHFGITTVEAMASGCVPVVIKLGGQAEIVTEDSGFFWTTRDELLKNTKKLIKNSKLLKEKSQNAIIRSKFFNAENFKNELKKYLPEFKQKD